MFQRNEAAQDVPVALVTKLLPFFFFFSVRMKHHFKHFSVQTSLPAWQKQICVSETHTLHLSQHGKDLLLQSYYNIVGKLKKLRSPVFLLIRLQELSHTPVLQPSPFLSPSKS